MPGNPQVVSSSGYHPHLRCPSPSETVTAGEAAAGTDGEVREVRYKHRSGFRQVSELSCQATHCSKDLGLWEHSGDDAGAMGGWQGTVPAVAATPQEHHVLAASAQCGAAGESHKSPGT